MVYQLKLTKPLSYQFYKVFKASKKMIKCQKNPNFEIVANTSIFFICSIIRIPYLHKKIALLGTLFFYGHNKSPPQMNEDI